MMPEFRRLWGGFSYKCKNKICKPTTEPWLVMDALPMLRTVSWLATLLALLPATCRLTSAACCLKIQTQTVRQMLFKFVFNKKMSFSVSSWVAEELEMRLTNLITLFTSSNFCRYLLFQDCEPLLNQSLAWGFGVFQMFIFLGFF
jgi:hypothetical protein